MNLYGCYFSFGGVSSENYNLIFANANTERLLSLNGNYETVSVFNKSGVRKHFIKDDYKESPLVFDAEIITADATPIPDSRKRSIVRWLFSHAGYRKMYPLGDDNLSEVIYGTDGTPLNLYLNCRFVSPEKIEANGGVIGYKFTVECDSHMAWQDPVLIENVCNISGTVGTKTITINVDSDLSEYIYPIVKITTGAVGGNIYITNQTDDASRITKFNNLSSNTEITMNGEINYLSGNHNNFEIPNFIRLLNGSNTFLLQGNIKSISFKWQNRRFL